MVDIFDDLGQNDQLPQSRGIDIFDDLANNPYSGHATPEQQKKAERRRKEVSKALSGEQGLSVTDKLKLASSAAGRSVRGNVAGLAPGFQDAFVRGSRQLIASGLENVGAVDEGYRASVDKQIALERAKEEEQLNELVSSGKAAPTAISAGKMLGAGLPALALPGGAAKLPAMLPRGAQTLGAAGIGASSGAATGAVQYAATPEEREQNIKFGAAVGGGLPLLAPAVGQTARTAGRIGKAAATTAVNRLAKKSTLPATATPEQAEIIKEGQKYGVDVFYPDIGGPTAGKIATAQESVPVVGMTKPRLQQNQQAQQAASGLLTNKEKTMLTRQYDDINALEQAARGTSKRAQAAQQLLQDIDNAGDDWNRIIQTSGNAKLFGRKLKADELYDRVETIADTLEGVPLNKTVNTLNKSIQELSEIPGTNQGAFINRLEQLRNDLLQTGADATDTPGIKNIRYSTVRNLRTQIAEEINDAMKGKAIGTTEARYLQQVKSALDNDLDTFAQTQSPELRMAWKEADKYYKENVIPYKDRQLAKALTTDEPDTIFDMFIRRGIDADGKYNNRAIKFYDALDDKGRAAVRYGVVRNALTKATNADGLFSPAKFARELETRAPGIDTFFKGKAQQELMGFKKLMRAVQRSGQVAENPPTGNRVIAAMVALGGAAIDLTTTAAIVANSYLTTKLFTSPTGRDFLIRATKTPQNSKAFRELMRDISIYLSGIATQEQARRRRDEN